MLVSAALILLVSAALIITGIRRVPGIGIIGGVVVLGLLAWVRPEHLAQFGTVMPANMWGTAGLALLLGIAIQLFATMLMDPLLEKLTHKLPDTSVAAGAQGNLENLAFWLLTAWLLAAVLEETIYRGFLINETTRILGTGPTAILLALLFSSAVFGLSHWYQGRSGILSTGSIGLLLGILFLASGFNIWLPILTHGFIDTAALLMTFWNAEPKLRQMVWKEQAGNTFPRGEPDQ